MKKIITFLTIALFAVSLKAQVVFTEGFDSGIPASFTLLNEDGNTPSANIVGIFTNKAWIGGYVFTGQEEVWAGSTSSYDPPGTADDWMITPSLIITNNNYLYWSARSGNNQSADGYEVRISTTGKNVADFDSVLFSIAAENSFWTERTVDLSGFVGDTVYIAFRNNSYDKYILAVDYITVKETYNIDLALTELDIEKLYSDTDQIQVKGTITNEGLDPVTSVDINWSTDGGATVNTHSLSGLNITAMGGVYTFTHTDLITASNPGNYIDLEVWLSNPDSTMDMYAGNDSIIMNIFVNAGTTGNKKVLLEEFTTAPCQFCPDGAVKVEEVLSQNPNVIAVGLHSCFGSDAMTIPEATAYCSAFSNAAPTATVDRVHFDGETQVGFSRATQTIANLWKARADEQSIAWTPLDLAVTGSYNSGSNSVELDINADFVDYAVPGDLRLTVFVLEDSVVGTGSGYNQVNYYNIVPGHEYYQKGNPIFGYVHRHVLRDVYPASNAWGDASVFPNTGIAPNDQFTKSVSISLNNAWDISQVSFVAFVSYYNDNTSERIVINAEDITLNEIRGVGISESITNQINIQVYPNPFKSQTNVNFSLKTDENVQIELLDMTGKLLMTKNLGRLNAGSHSEIIKAEDFTNGIYMLRITAGENSSLQKISILK